MVTVDEYGRIRRAHAVDGLGIRALALAGLCSFVIKLSTSNSATIFRYTQAPAGTNRIMALLNEGFSMIKNRLGVVLRNIRALAAVDCTDARLLERFATLQEEEAFAALMNRHGPMVLGVCRRVAGHAEDAEDAFQATFLLLARKAGAIRRRESVSSWLHGVARRVASGGCDSPNMRLKHTTIPRKWRGEAP